MEPEGLMSKTTEWGQRPLALREDFDSAKCACDVGAGRCIVSVGLFWARRASLNW